MLDDVEFEDLLVADFVEALDDEATEQFALVLERHEHLLEVLRGA